MHPLMPNLTELTDEQLTEKITKILERMTFASSTGNGALYQQLHNIYLDLLDEQNNRLVKSQTRTNDDEEDPFDGLINIRKK